MKAKNKLNKNLFVDIPNTEEGREAIKTIRKYINRDLVKTIRTRGRGSRRETVKGLENYKTLVESKMSTEELLQYLQDTLPYVSRWQERCIKLSAIDLIGGLK